jgi:hypothetical protein
MLNDKLILGGSIVPKGCGTQYASVDFLDKILQIKKPSVVRRLIGQYFLLFTINKSSFTNYKLGVALLNHIRMYPAAKLIIIFEHYFNPPK